MKEVGEIVVEEAMQKVQGPAARSRPVFEDPSSADRWRPGCESSLGEGEETWRWGPWGQRLVLQSEHEMQWTVEFHHGLRDEEAESQMGVRTQLGCSIRKARWRQEGLRCGECQAKAIAS